MCRARIVARMCIFLLTTGPHVWKFVRAPYRFLASPQVVRLGHGEVEGHDSAKTDAQLLACAIAESPVPPIIVETSLATGYRAFLVTGHEEWGLTLRPTGAGNNPYSWIKSRDTRNDFCVLFRMRPDDD